MLGMNGLLSGTPVLITNGSLPLALCSWYFPPDLIVLQNKKAMSSLVTCSCQGGLSC